MRVLTPFALLLVLPLTACATVTQEDGTLNHQTRRAGVHVQNDSKQVAEVVQTGVKAGEISEDYARRLLDLAGKMNQTGSDVEQNSAVLADVLPDPEDPAADYSKKGSADARKASIEADRKPFLLGVLTDLTGALGWEWIGTALTTAFGLFMFIKKKGTDRRLKGTYEGVQLAINQAKDGKAASAIKAAVKSGQQAWNVWNEVAPELKRLKDRGELSQDKTKES
jgi:polyhydroxyalkanoate synthesis regulator phasin